MPSFTFPKVLLSLFLMINLAFASRYRFSITDITVNNVRDIMEDDLTLVVASSTTSGVINNTWSLGSAEDGSSFRWDNITQEIDVPTTGSNLSIAFGVINSAEGGEQTALEFVETVVNVASSAPGPVGTAFDFLSTLVDYGADLLNCDGPVVAGSIVYGPDAINNFDQNQPGCSTQSYEYPPGKITCGTDPSKYTVTYCLERLDAKGTANAAALDRPVGLAWALLGLAVVFVYELL